MDNAILELVVKGITLLGGAGVILVAITKYLTALISKLYLEKHKNKLAYRSELFIKDKYELYKELSIEINLTQDSIDCTYLLYKVEKELVRRKRLKKVCKKYHRDVLTIINNLYVCYASKSFLMSERVLRLFGEYLVQAKNLANNMIEKDVIEELSCLQNIKENLTLTMKKEIKSEL